LDGGDEEETNGDVDITSMSLVLPWPNESYLSMRFQLPIPPAVKGFWKSSHVSRFSLPHTFVVLQ
jgi:hypothetical protein